MIEIKGQRDYRKKMIVDDQGKTQIHFFTGDIFYNNKLGLGDGVMGFRPVDYTLQWIDSPRRGWTFFFHSFQPFCPEYADDFFGYRDLFQGKDQTIAFKARTAAHVLGQLDAANNRVIYTDAFGPGMDLILQITRHSMQKLVRIREGFYPAADKDFDFIMRFPDGKGVYEMSDTGVMTELDPLTPKALGARSQIYIGSDQHDGEDWYTRVYPVKIWDSAPITGPKTGQKQALTPAAIAVVGGATVLRKRVQASFFVGAVGDVYTDAVFNYTTGGDTFYGTSFSPGPNGSSTSLSFGGWGDAYHSYYKFDNITGITGSRVTLATFNFYDRSPSVNDPVVQIRRITSSWSEATLTRTLLPTDNTTNRGTMATLAGGSARYVAATITTLIQDWLNGVSTNFGLKMHSTVTANQNNGSGDSRENTNVPYVALTLSDVTQTITGKARIQGTTTKTETGKARLQKSVAQTISGLARISGITPRTESGVANILNSTLRTEAGVSRIQKAALQTILGVARITRVILQTETGVSRITKVVLGTIMGVARITAVTLKDETGVARITAQTLKTVSGVAKITGLGVQNELGVANIRATTLQIETGKARIQISSSQDETGVSRIQIVTTRNIAGVSRITKVVAATETGVSRVTASAARTEDGKARIQASTSQNETGISRIQRVVMRDETGVARIQTFVTRTIDGKARVEKLLSANELGLARIQKALDRAIAGVARIRRQESQNETGKARIQRSEHDDIQGLARITAAANRTETGKARITGRTTQTITGVSRIIPANKYPYTRKPIGPYTRKASSPYAPKVSPFTRKTSPYSKKDSPYTNFPHL